MITRDANSRKLSPAARAEAAAWIARLHGLNRTEEVEVGLRRWLAEDPEHAAAFELLTDTWEKSARIRRRPAERVASWELVGFRISFSRAALATMVTAVLAISGTILYLHSDAVTTGVGELRILTLDDGTRVHLNTDTRVLVQYNKALRRVRLERGEALFDVAKHSERPFVVMAGGREIKALGTEFVVRTDAQNLAVTLVEGKVSIAPADSKQDSSRDRKIAGAQYRGGGIIPTQTLEAETVTLSPGQRLTVASAGSAKIDRPSLERVTAWERGQVALDDTPLGEAAAEMNRHSKLHVVIDDPAVAAIRISGVFRAGDSANFAQAVAQTYHLRLLDQADKIVLAAAHKEQTSPAAD